MRIKVRRWEQMKKLIGVLLLGSISLSACGYKGDLYLPPKAQKVEKPKTNTSAPAVAGQNSNLKHKIIASGAISNNN